MFNDLDQFIKIKYACVLGEKPYDKNNSTINITIREIPDFSNTELLSYLKTFKTYFFILYSWESDDNGRQCQTMTIIMTMETDCFALRAYLTLQNRINIL